MFGMGRTGKPDTGILLGLQDVEQTVREAGMLLDLSLQNRVSTWSRYRRHHQAVTRPQQPSSTGGHTSKAKQQGRAVRASRARQGSLSYLLELELSATPVVGIRLQTRSEQASDGSSVHDG